MAEQDEFYVPEEIDKQIERVSQFKEGDRLDAKALAYLRSYYQENAQQEQESLDRMWNRIASTTFFEQDTRESENEPVMKYPGMQYGGGTTGSSPESHPRRASLMQRLGVLAAAVILVALVGSMALVFYAVRHSQGGTASPQPTSTISNAHVPLKVTSVAMSVTPESIANLSCGTTVTVTYTALFHVEPNSTGGTVHFSYTVNNGRGQTPASITFGPGQTTKAYTFTWSGALPADHTYPEAGGVQVTSPNQLTSPLVGPTGQCTPLAAFRVTNVDMTVSPTSIQGLSCGTSIVVTYTATIHVAANSPGGTVQFSYTVNNGRGQTPASIAFSPGQTMRTYSFMWRGALPLDHTYPGYGGIQITSPNQLTSQLVAPSGRCS